MQIGLVNLGQLGLHGKADIEKTKRAGNVLSKHEMFLDVCSCYSVKELAQNCLLIKTKWPTTVHWAVMDFTNQTTETRNFFFIIMIE